MGFEVERFEGADSINPDLLCPICNDVLEGMEKYKEKTRFLLIELNLVYLIGKSTPNSTVNELDGVYAANCEHYFCRECITSWLESDQSCPIDRMALTVEELMMPQFKLNKKHKKLPMAPPIEKGVRIKRKYMAGTISAIL